MRFVYYNPKVSGLKNIKFFIIIILISKGSILVVQVVIYTNVNVKTLLIYGLY